MIAKTNWTSVDSETELRILYSGGIESAVLMGEAIEAGLNPIPVYISTGTRWEKVELNYAKISLESLHDGLSDLMVVLNSIPNEGRDHWAYKDGNYPHSDDDIQTLKIEGRNKDLLRASMNFGRKSLDLILAIGTTAENPFEDGNRNYFDKMESVLSEEYGAGVTILSPLIDLTKSDVIKRGERFRLGNTLSCIAPREGKACGHCIKCGSRAAAFKKANIIDKNE